MHVRGTFAALALTALFALPTLASASIVQRWQSLPANYTVVSQLNDFNADGSFEMLTLEPAGGGTVKVGVRSCSTGALLATTVGTYLPTQFWLTYLEPTNEIEEIIFADQLTGNLVCVNYTTGATSLPVRWSFQPTSSGVPPVWTFVDFDGTGQLYMAFKDPLPNTPKYYVRDNAGTLVTTIDQTAQVTTSGWSVALYVDNFEVDNRQQLMIDYHYSSPSSDVLFVFDNGVPGSAAPADAASGLQPAQHARPAVRSFEPLGAGWVESGHTELAASAVPNAVRLP